MCHFITPPSHQTNQMNSEDPIEIATELPNSSPSLQDNLLSQRSARDRDARTWGPAWLTASAMRKQVLINHSTSEEFHKFSLNMAFRNLPWQLSCFMDWELRPREEGELIQDTHLVHYMPEPEDKFQTTSAECSLPHLLWMIFVTFIHHVIFFGIMLTLKLGYTWTKEGKLWTSSLSRRPIFHQKEDEIPKSIAIRLKDNKDNWQKKAPI